VSQQDTTRDQTRVVAAHDRALEGSDQLSMVVLHSPASDLIGRRYDVDSLPTCLGRTLENDVVLNEESISRRHARLSLGEDRWLVEDLGSTNGTFVNQHPAGDGTPVRPGDKLTLGRTVLKLVDRRDEEAAFYERTYRMAVTDGLTALYNKRFLFQTLQREISRARRHGHPLALVMADVDHFKQINDQHGHTAGDRVLKQLAVLIQEQLRSHDLVARFGGEEFAVVLPETELAGARRVAHKIREAVEAHPFTDGDRLFRVTISLGCALLHDIDRDPEDLIHRADDRLYKAKAAGRNRVVSEPNATQS
jgi:diguanylate cyclase (GGDEF)-like protein